MNTTNQDLPEGHKDSLRNTALHEFLVESAEIFRSPFVWIGIIGVSLGLAGSYVFVSMP